MTINIILNKLSKVKNTSRNKWIACCPCHQDKSPSLSIKDDGGTILMYCFGCGVSGADVCVAIGEDVSALFPASDYSNYTSNDYEIAARKRSYFSADQVLEALQSETTMLLMLTKDALENGISEEVRARMLLSIYRINAVNIRYQRR